MASQLMARDLALMLRRWSKIDLELLRVTVSNRMDHARIGLAKHSPGHCVHDPGRLCCSSGYFGIIGFLMGRFLKAGWRGTIRACYRFVIATPKNEHREQRNSDRHHACDEPVMNNFRREHGLLLGNQPNVHCMLTLAEGQGCHSTPQRFSPCDPLRIAGFAGLAPTRRRSRTGHRHGP